MMKLILEIELDFFSILIYFNNNLFFNYAKIFYNLKFKILSKLIKIINLDNKNKKFTQFLIAIKTNKTKHICLVQLLINKNK